MLSENLSHSLRMAYAIAKDLNHEYTTLEHLLLALARDDAVQELLSECNANIDEFLDTLESFLKYELNALEVQGEADPKPTTALQKITEGAIDRCCARGKSTIENTDILIEILSEKECHGAYFLREHNVNFHNILKYSYNREWNPNENEESYIKNAFSSSESNVKVNNYNDNISEGTKECLKNYCTNLNELARKKKTDALIGRDEEIERTIEILLRRSKSNPLYVGDPGVGKTAIAEGLAHRIINKQVPRAMKSKVILSLDIGSLLAGTKYRGDFEERMKSLIKEITDNPNLILFIDEMHTIIGTGSTNNSSMDASNLLKPVLARSEIRCIGSTTHAEYNKYVSKDRALSRRFQRINIAEPSISDAIKILKGIKSNYEKHHNVRYTDDALRKAVELSHRYIREQMLPDKAVDVMDEAGSYGAIKGKQSITARDISSTIARITKIPCNNLLKNEGERINEVHKIMKRKIKGQDDAIEKLMDNFKTSATNLRSTYKPMGCYLFCGPTGVGKTEFATQFAQSLDMHLLRFDMSEYMEKHSISKLIGSPPGYVGHDNGSMLTEKMLKNPYCVILLDEIEKAHPDIQNILLQIMDYGKLTDSDGREINFCNAMIIMTTNVGSTDKDAIGFVSANNEDIDLESVNNIFKPEFRNRLDAIIPFRKLKNDSLIEITKKQIGELSDVMKKNYRMEIECDKRAMKSIAMQGKDKEYGVRALERFIDKTIKKKMAEKILSGEFVKGDNILLTMHGKDVRIECK